MSAQNTHTNILHNERKKIIKIELNENISINYDKTRKFGNYNNRNYACCRESIDSNQKSMQYCGTFYNTLRMAKDPARRAHVWADNWKKTNGTSA